MANRKTQRIGGILVERQTDIKQRRCLGHCGEQFVPAHRGNYVCAKCTAANNEINGREYTVARKINFKE